jgi:hypothetical protein
MDTNNFAITNKYICTKARPNLKLKKINFRINGWIYISSAAQVYYSSNVHKV